MNKFKTLLRRKMLVDIPRFLMDKNGACVWIEYISLNLLETEVLNYVSDGLMKLFLDNKKFCEILYAEAASGYYEDVPEENKFAYENLFIKVIEIKSRELISEYISKYITDNCFMHE